ncbi:MAG: hypothetical protein IKM66_01700 [Clostridia bacterium]|nr:hypothetical protein [Clostridia bacterium]
MSINFNLDDLDFSFDDFEIDLDIDLSFDFDFLNEQRANKEKMQKSKHERSPRKTRLKPRGSQERSREEAVKNPLEAVTKR